MPSHYSGFSQQTSYPLCSQKPSSFFEYHLQRRNDPATESGEFRIIKYKRKQIFQRITGWVRLEGPQWVI